MRISTAFVVMLSLACPAMAQQASESDGYVVNLKVCETNAQGRKKVVFEKVKLSVPDQATASGFSVVTYSGKTVMINGTPRDGYVSYEYSLHVQRHWSGLVRWRLQLNVQSDPSEKEYHTADLVVDEFAVPGKRRILEPKDVRGRYTLELEMNTPRGPGE